MISNRNLLNIWKLWKDIYILPFVSDNQMRTFFIHHNFLQWTISQSRKKSIYKEPMLHVDFWFL